jgi:hypothetical protein
MTKPVGQRQGSISLHEIESVCKLRSRMYHNPCHRCIHNQRCDMHMMGEKYGMEGGETGEKQRSDHD